LRPQCDHRLKPGFSVEIWEGSPASTMPVHTIWRLAFGSLGYAKAGGVVKTG
jgi:hypothetical protein